MASLQDLSAAVRATEEWIDDPLGPWPKNGASGAKPWMS